METKGKVRNFGLPVARTLTMTLTTLTTAFVRDSYFLSSLLPTLNPSVLFLYVRPPV